MTWNKLKWIALVCMLLDHINKVIPLQLILLNHFGVGLAASYYLFQVMSVFGRAAFPIYAYGIAQGCMYTHSPKRYLFNLLLFAVISEIPYNLTLWIGIPRFAFHNVFFTLLMGAVCCYIYRFFREHKMAWVSFVPITCLVLLAEFLKVDYGGFGILFILVPFIFFKNKRASLLALGVVTAVFYIFVTQFNGMGFQWMHPENTSCFFLWDCAGALLGVVLLALYNGQKGKTYNKWFFYAAYPGHLLLLYLLKMVIPV